MMAKQETKRETMTMGSACKMTEAGSCMKNKKYKCIVSYGKSWQKNV